MALLGIDYGTCHVDAAVYDNDRISNVLFDGEESITSDVFVEERLYFGKGAVERGKRNPHHLLRNIKRFIGRDISFIQSELRDNPSFRVVKDGDVDVLEVVDLKARYPLLSIVMGMFQYVVEKAKVLAGDIRLIMLSCPPSWNENQRTIYKRCAERLGIPCYLNTETVSSALSCGFRQGTDPIDLLVVDGGGGTFDVTSLRITQAKGFEVIVTDGLQIGGYEFTEQVLTDMEQKLRILGILGDDERLSPKERANLWSAAEEMKIMLSKEESYSVDVTVKGVSTMLSYTSQGLANICRLPLQQCLKKVRDVLEKTEQAGFRPTICLSCGEGLKMGCLRNSISELFNKDNVFSSFRHSVSRGAVSYARTVIRGHPPVHPALPPPTPSGRAFPLPLPSMPIPIDIPPFETMPENSTHALPASGNTIPALPAPDHSIPALPASGNTIPALPAPDHPLLALPPLPASDEGQHLQELPLTSEPLQLHEKRTYSLYMAKAMSTTGHDLRPMVKASDDLPAEKKQNWTVQANQPLRVKLFEGREPFQSRCRCIRILELERDDKHPLASSAQYVSYVRVDASGSVSMQFMWRDTCEEIQVIADYSPDRESVIPRQMERLVE